MGVVEENCSATERAKMVPRKIVAFHQDEHGDWVAKLECGHQQHVRHNPPWTNRAWVITRQGRDEHLGYELQCPNCAKPPDSGPANSLEF